MRRGRRARDRATVPRDTRLVPLEDHAVDLLGDLHEHDPAMQRDQRQPVALRRLDHRRRRGLERATELEDEARDRQRGERLDVLALGLTAVAQTHAVGEQQLAAPQGRCGGREVRDVHPSHGPFELVAPGTVLAPRRASPRAQGRRRLWARRPRSSTTSAPALHLWHRSGGPWAASHASERCSTPTVHCQSCRTRRAPPSAPTSTSSGSPRST